MPLLQVLPWQITHHWEEFLHQVKRLCDAQAEADFKLINRSWEWQSGASGIIPDCCVNHPRQECKFNYLCWKCKTLLIAYAMSQVCFGELHSPLSVSNMFYRTEMSAAICYQSEALYCCLSTYIISQSNVHQMTLKQPPPHLLRFPSCKKQPPLWNKNVIV